jgi:hypothetical protein
MAAIDHALPLGMAHRQAALLTVCAALLVLCLLMLDRLLPLGRRSRAGGPSTS